MATAEDSKPQRRLEDHHPEAKIDWTQPGAPAVPLLNTVGAAKGGIMSLEGLTRHGFCDIDESHFIERPDGEYLAFADVERLLATQAQAAAPATDERALFEAWHRSKFATKHSTGQPTRDMHNGVYAEKYGPENQQQMWEAFQAGAAIAHPAAAVEPVAIPAGMMLTEHEIAAIYNAASRLDALHELSVTVGVLHNIVKRAEAAPSPAAEDAAKVEQRAGDAQIIAQQVAKWTRERARLQDLINTATGAAPSEQQAAPEQASIEPPPISRRDIAALLLEASSNQGYTWSEYADWMKAGSDAVHELAEWARKAYACFAAAAGKAAVEPLTQAAQDVLAERHRQVEQEGWTPDHDDMHSDGQMAVAAGYYALACAYPHERDIGHRSIVPTYWPWAPSWWKPRDRRSNLVRAGALVLAEIERIDRAAMSSVSANGGKDGE